MLSPVMFSAGSGAGDDELAFAVRSRAGWRTRGRPSPAASHACRSRCAAAARRCRARAARRGTLRLVLEHVERGAGDATLHERIDERRLVDDRAARHVDDEAVRARAPRARRLDTRWCVDAPPAAAMTRKSAQRASSSERWLEGIRHVRHRRAIRVAHAPCRSRSRASRSSRPMRPSPKMPSRLPLTRVVERDSAAAPTTRRAARSDRPR